MTIASSNFTTLSYSPESTYGEIPDTKPFRYVPMTGESLQYTKESITSNTLESSRQITDQVQTGFQVGGGFDYELAPKYYDEFMQGIMWSTWGTATSEEGGIELTVVATSGTLTATAGTTFGTLIAGDFVQISGMDAVGNNGVFQVDEATSATEIIVHDYDSTLVDVTDNTTVTVRGNSIKNAKVDWSYYFEKNITDLDPDEFFSYSGCKANSFSVSAQSSSIVTGSFDFVGQTSEEYATNTRSDSAVQTTTLAGILNAVGDVGGVRINGVTQSSIYFQSLDFSIENNLRGIQAIGTKGNVDVSPGQFGVTGTLNAYFSDKTMYKKFLDDEEFSLSYEVIDTSTKEGFSFYFPRVVISSSTMSASGSDQDLVENISWTALKSASDANVPNVTVQICRFLADYDTAPDNIAT